jgi:transposase-like protein
VNYTQGFKARMVQRMAGPRADTACSLAKESGVSQSTLSRWLREASTVSAMGNQRGNEESRGLKKWTAEEKLRVVIAASSLPEEQLGQLLRREGLHTAQLEEWRTLVMEALAGRKPTTAKNPSDVKLTKENKELARDLDRKNRALAEVTALLTLQKKIQAIWGDEEGNTPPDSGT